MDLHIHNILTGNAGDRGSQDTDESRFHVGLGVWSGVGSIEQMLVDRFALF